MTFSIPCRANACASSAVKNCFSLNYAGRSSGVKVWFVQLPCMSGLPSGVRGMGFAAAFRRAADAVPDCVCATADESTRSDATASVVPSMCFINIPR